MHTSLNKHTHTYTSWCRFLLQLFISLWHFEACSSLPVSLPLNSSFSFALLLSHSMHFCFPSSFLLDSSPLSSLSVWSLLSDISSCHWTKWNVGLPSFCFAVPFTPLCSCCITDPSFTSCLLACYLSVIEWGNKKKICFLYSSDGDTGDDLSPCLLWEPWSLWSVPLFSNKDGFDSVAPWKKHTAWIHYDVMSSEKSILCSGDF